MNLFICHLRIARQYRWTIWPEHGYHEKLGGLDLSRKFRIVDTPAAGRPSISFLASHVLKTLRSWLVIPPLAGVGQGHMLTCQDSNPIDKISDVFGVVISGRKHHCDRLREIELDLC